MLGITRVSSAGVTGNFTMFGTTFGFGTDVQVSSNWSVGANLRIYNLGPADAKSEGQHVDGVNVTVNAKYRF